MKFSYLAIPLALVHGVFSNPFLVNGRNACNPNNCARAITGTNAQPASATRKADCSSYMQTTITPAPATVTLTFSLPPVTTHYTESVRCTVTAARNVTSSGSCQTWYSLPAPSKSYTTITWVPTTSTIAATKTKPAYASACTVSGTINEYSSACSCWGITATSTTLPRSTYTSTVTVAGHVFTTIDIVTTTTTVSVSYPTSTG